jgi:orotate phosphoribosyltransferase
LAYRLLHWPPWLVRHFDRERESEVRGVLDRIGFGEDFRDRARPLEMQRRIAGVARYTDPVARAVQLLGGRFVEGQYDVGWGYSFSPGYFIDVMSASLDPYFAEECTNILTSCLRERGSEIPVFDVVVGLKNGSPILAWKFGQRLNLKAVLFRGIDNYKRNRSARRPSDLFDGDLQDGAKALIVDDSTTGGRMVLDCAETIRELGCEVNHCLVLFEPLGKGAREKLRDKGVDLISVIKIDRQTLGMLRNLARERVPPKE